MNIFKCLFSRFNFHFKSKHVRYIEIDKSNPIIKETNEKLEKIFPNSKITFKLEDGTRKFISVYINDEWVAEQPSEYFNWDTILHMLRFTIALDNPEILGEEYYIPRHILLKYPDDWDKK